MIIQIASSQLPEQFARMTARGIQFREHYYSCGQLLKGRWYDQVLLKGDWDIKIYHNPDCDSFILVPHERFGLIVAIRLDNIVLQENIEEIQEYHQRFQLLKARMRRMRNTSRK